MATRAVMPTVVAPITQLPTAADLTPQVVDAIKQALQDIGLPPKVYKFTVDDKVIVFRPLYRSDWLEIEQFLLTNNEQVRQDALDEKICQMAICWPREITLPIHWERQLAGVQMALARQIRGRSGFILPDMPEQADYIRVDPLTTVEPGPKPTPETIDQLKVEYSIWSLKQVFIDGDYYVVRPLNRGEWRQVPNPEEGDAELFVAQRGTVWSRDYPNEPNFAGRIAGTVNTLSQVIMQISGFVNAPLIEEL